MAAPANFSEHPAIPEEPLSPETSPPNEPAPKPVDEEPGFGWSTYAERLNGRFAMVGFVALLLLELMTHQDFFTWLGWVTD